MALSWSNLQTAVVGTTTRSHPSIYKRIISAFPPRKPCWFGTFHRRLLSVHGTTLYLAAYPRCCMCTACMPWNFVKLLVLIDLVTYFLSIRGWSVFKHENGPIFCPLFRKVKSFVV